MMLVSFAPLTLTLTIHENASCECAIANMWHHGYCKMQFVRVINLRYPALYDLKLLEVFALLVV